MNRKLRALYASLGEVVARAPLAAKHEKRPEGLRISALSPEMTEMHVYGEIGGGWFDGGVNAADFGSELRDISTPNLTVHISSPGGDVFEAVAMHTALRNWRGTVTTVNDALAASAASFLAMAGDKIRTEQGAMWMLHAASTMTYGTKRNHYETGDLLGKVTDNIAEFYALRAGGTTEEWLALLDSGDNWYTAVEALELGITDEIATDAPEAKVNARLRYLVKNTPALRNAAPEIEEIKPAETETVAETGPEIEEIPEGDEVVSGEHLLAEDIPDAQSDDDFAHAMRMTHFMITSN